MTESLWRRLAGRMRRSRPKATSAVTSAKRRKPRTPTVAPFVLKGEHEKYPRPLTNSRPTPAEHAWLPLYGTANRTPGLSPSGNATPDDKTVLSSLRLQLADIEDVPSLSNLTHVRAYAPGLVELLTVSTPEAVIAPPATDLAHLGSPEELVEVARHNLVHTLADIGEEIEVRHFETTEGLTFTGLLGDSLSVASLAIELPRVSRLLHPGSDLSKGVFVAVPNAHHLALRIVDNVSSLMSVGPMSVFARNGYKDSGATSPHVYWAHGEHLETLTPLTTHERGQIAIRVPPALSELLDR
ncbi:hypothetical protein [Dermatophilus congolensis]|uniref:hypothetical protein n=1 Tax=Dermatophilus congolensis TaxID=1863 RepID=UPI001AAE35B4|nr:hypothetical protein [Dermatophilus congolensis]MBO3142276.1 hypothetical protein [Dermatophilus congolensis]MBO3151267.1 hypothetical protein [Dermatophilus congolensis]MBO3161729.1 hypothetical protein [Dermatophilus congolensis]MBO3162553.1 hypothetical protein [Dermatophilus congolensis]MBO3176106.1 hypothetical protein [Dermatophilus congolensis]